MSPHVMMQARRCTIFLAPNLPEVTVMFIAVTFVSHAYKLLSRVSG